MAIPEEFPSINIQTTTRTENPTVRSVRQHYRYRGACVRGALGPQRIDRQTRRRDRKGGRGSYNQIRISAPRAVYTHARDTRQHAYRYRTVTVPLPYRTPHVIPKSQASDGSMRSRALRPLTHADARRRTAEARP